MVTSHAHAPGGIEVGDETAFELEGGIGRVLSCTVVRLAVLVPACGNVGGAQARDSLYRAEQVIQDIAPVAEHVDDDAASVLFPVVPGRPLRRDGIAFEDPVSEFAAHRKNGAEEPEFFES